MVDPLTGTLLSGRYRLLEPVRSEEAGFAWEAKDEMLGRRVAVKELTLPDDVPDIVRPGLLRQAAALARSTGRLTHDGLITVYDVFEDRDRVWVITQLVAGRTLSDDITAKGRWNPERVALLGVRLCEALEAVHISQMVHRDVRPGNVVIPDRGGAMLSDLATSTAVEVARQPSVYVAPERRSGQRVTVAADLFGLGATLYFAAVGKPPTAPLAYPPGVLGKVIAGLMVADPAARMPLHKARDLLAASVTTPEETLDEAALPPPAPRKRRRVAALIFLALAVVLTGAAFAFLQDHSKGTPTAHPSAPTSRASTTTVPDTTAPQPPAGLRVLGRTTNAITLAWEPATDDVGIAGYRILRNGQQVGEASAPAYTDNGLATNTAYTYTVVSLDAAGNASQPSTAASAVTLKIPDTKKPTVPSRVHVTGRSTTAIVLSWAASADDIGVTAYEVFRNGSQVASVTGTRFRDNGLSPKTTYTYQVRALDAAGNASALSPKVSAVTLTTPDTVPPSVPKAFHASSPAPSLMTLTWQASTDNVGVYEYLLSRPGLATVHVDGLIYTDMGLMGGTAYPYQLRAVDLAGNVSAAATVTGTTRSTPPPPPMVTDVSTVASVDSGQCTVTVNATVKVSSAPADVTLLSNLPGPSGVSFAAGELSKTVQFGPMPVTADGIATVSATTTNTKSASVDYSVPTTCGPGFGLSAPQASADACPSMGISGSVTITAWNNSGDVAYNVTMLVDGAEAATATATVAPRSSKQVSVGPTPDLSPGTHTVSFTVTGGGGSNSASAGDVTIDCPGTP
jgi:chitodextrinase